MNQGKLQETNKKLIAKFILRSPTAYLNVFKFRSTIIIITYSPTYSDSGNCSALSIFYVIKKTWQYSDGSENNTFPSIPSLTSENHIFNTCNCIKQSRYSSI